MEYIKVGYCIFQRRCVVGDDGIGTQLSYRLDTSHTFFNPAATPILVLKAASVYYDGLACVCGEGDITTGGRQITVSCVLQVGLFMMIYQDLVTNYKTTRRLGWLFSLLN